MGPFSPQFFRVTSAHGDHASSGVPPTCQGPAVQPRFPGLSWGLCDGFLLTCTCLAAWDLVLMLTGWLPTVLDTDRPPRAVRLRPVQAQGWHIHAFQVPTAREIFSLNSTSS